MLREQSQLLNNLDVPMHLFREEIFCNPGQESRQYKPLLKEMSDSNAFGT